MLASSIPTKFPIPWANSAGAGFIRSIPVNSQIGIQNGAASLTDGFPPLTFIQEAAGGVPPFGQDTNGILQQITAWIRWQNAGAPVSYDGTFSASVAGYPIGSILTTAASPSAWWVSTVDGNTTNPDTGGAGWLLIQPSLVYPGNPNTHIAGTAGNPATGQPPSEVWDTANKIWWTCITSGNAASAVWTEPLGSGLDSYCGTSTGTANSQSITAPASIQSLSAGTVLSFTAGLTNTSALGVSISGFGTFATRKDSISGPITLIGGEVVAGNMVMAMYDGAVLHILNPAQGTGAQANLSTNTGIAAAVQGAGSIVPGNFAQFSNAAGTVVDSGVSPGSINGVGFITLYMQGDLF